MEQNENKFLIIDGNSIMNRAFYGIRILTTKDGTYTNAAYGFLNIYYMMQEKLNPNYVAVAFDISKPTFRHEMYGEYKAGRRSMPDELRPQLPLIKDILSAMNIPILELEGYEADDILGTVAKNNSRRGIKTYILTGDRDSFQLIDENTNIVMPSTKMGKTEYTIYDIPKLKEVYNIEPKQIIDMKALMGDKSDNIPGVPLVGEKTTLSLLESYNNLDYIYSNVDTIDISDKLRQRLIDNKDMAYLSYRLATINTDVPVNMDYEEFKLKAVNLPKLSQLFTRLSFKKFLERYITGDEIKNLETDSAAKFYKDLSNTKFNILTKVDEVNNVILNNNNDIIFTYIDNDFSYDKLRNKLLLYIEESIYVIDMPQETLKQVLKTFCDVDRVKIGYNTKKALKLYFDAGYKNPIGFNQDVMIAYYLLHATETNYSITNIVYNLLDVVFPELEDTAKKKPVQTSLFDMLDTPGSLQEEKLELTENIKKYIYTYLKGIKEANNILNERLKEFSLEELYANIEIPLIETLANIESNGMYLDTNKLKEFCVYLDEHIKDLTTKIYNLAGEEFNINSPAQLGRILFEKLDLPCSKKTKTSYSTDKEVLEAIEDKHEIVPLVLEYRSLSKLASTYGEGLLNCVEEDGRIHTTFMQAVTATGRLSSVEPNLQNIPVRTEIGSKIRECFTASSENTKLIDADYSQIELRVLASMANDDNMIKAFISGTDIHSVTASEVFDVPLEEVTKELRSKAKAVNFGIVYGISDYGLAKNINVTRAEAKEYITNYLNHYTGIANFMTNSIKFGETNGYVKTEFGRIRNVPELKSSNYNTKSFGERVAMNMPIQGTAADIMKIAMNSLYNKFKENNLKSKIVMQVHDELIVEAVIDELDRVKEYMKDAMENATKLKVPLAIDINVGNSWVEAK